MSRTSALLFTTLLLLVLAGPTATAGAASIRTDPALESCVLPGDPETPAEDADAVDGLPGFGATRTAAAAALFNESTRATVDELADAVLPDLDEPSVEDEGAEEDEAGSELEDETEADEDCEDRRLAEREGGVALGRKVSLTRRGVLTRPTVDTGVVYLAGPGTVTQQLWLPRRPRAAAAAQRRGGPRVAAGSVRRTVAKAGAVRLSARLTGAARRYLRSARRDVRITVRTTTRLRGGATRIRTGTILVRRR